MPEIQNSMTDFRKTQQEFERTRSDFYQDIPHECSNELQYMLNHIMKSVCSNGESGEDIVDCIRKATGHLRRAHLDYLKFAVYTLYTHLTASQARHIPNFFASLLKARLYEFSNIGSPRHDSIEAYRETLREFVPKAKLVNFLQPASEHPDFLDVKHKPHKAGSVSEETIKLYMEWARLELLLAAVANKRFHQIVLAVVQFYYQGTLHQNLPYLIAVTKLKILTVFEQSAVKAIRETGEGVFADPADAMKFRECQEADKAIAGNLDAKARKEAKNRLILAVEEPFSLLMKFFNINLADYPISFQSAHAK